MNTDPRAEVLEANRKFYEVFRLGDFLRMDAMWSHVESVSVCHPNGTGISGRRDVMESWHRVMVQTDPPLIYPSSETVVLNGSKAIVLCIEQIGGREIAATNIFTHEANTWRLVHHQATSLPARAAR